MFHDDLKDFVEKEVVPTNLELVYFIFFERGIDYNAFNELPIPYILSILATNRYIKKEEEKEMNKSSSKGRGVL